MHEISNQILEIFNKGEPIGALLAFAVAIGFALAKGTHKTGKAIHRKWKSKSETPKLLD